MVLNTVTEDEDLTAVFTPPSPWRGNLAYQWQVSENAALTSPDTGDGSDGPLVVSSLDTVVNDYAYITDLVIASGSTTFTVDDATGFAIGDEILVLQMHDATNTGVYEFTDITNVSGNDITANLTNSYTSGDANVVAAEVTQIVRVPQYTTVTINAASSIVADEWNGQTGGVVAFRATGAVTITGDIDVSGQGYRGGIYQAANAGDYAYGSYGENEFGYTTARATNANPVGMGRWSGTRR